MEDKLERDKDKRDEEEAEKTQPGRPATTEDDDPSRGGQPSGVGKEGENPPPPNP